MGTNRIVGLAFISGWLIVIGYGITALVRHMAQFDQALRLALMSYGVLALALLGIGLLAFVWTVLGDGKSKAL